MSSCDMKHLMAVETSFSKGPILDMQDEKVKHFAADKGESLNCRVSIEAKMSHFICAC